MRWMRNSASCTALGCADVVSAGMGLPLFASDINQNDGQACETLGTIAPDMHVSALDQHIACPQKHLAFFHDGIDLAGHHERIVDGVGRMEARTPAIRGAVVAVRKQLREQRVEHLLAGRRIRRFGWIVRIRSTLPFYGGSSPRCCEALFASPILARVSNSAQMSLTL